jgi:hypothetical protein
MSKENTSADFPSKSQSTFTFWNIWDLIISTLMDKFVVYPPILVSLAIPIISVLRGKSQFPLSRTVCTTGSLVAGRTSGSNSIIQKFR